MYSLSANEKRGAGNLDQPRVGSVHLGSGRSRRNDSAERHKLIITVALAANVDSRLLARDIKRQVEEAFKKKS